MWFYWTVRSLQIGFFDRFLDIGKTVLWWTRGFASLLEWFHTDEEKSAMVFCFRGDFDCILGNFDDGVTDLRAHLNWTIDFSLFDAN